MRYLELTKCPVVFLLIVMTCLAFCPILVVSSQVSTAVVVEPSTISARMGESFDVTVSLSAVQNLYGLEVILNWDPAVLRVVNRDIRLGVETFSDGVLHESSSSPPILIAEDILTESRGEYRLAATSYAPAPSFNGSGNIVKIKSSYFLTCQIIYVERYRTFTVNGKFYCCFGIERIRIIRDNFN